MKRTPAPRSTGLLYLSVAADLRNRIVLGEFPPGARLPSEVALAGQLGVARTTVREALRALASEGLVGTTRGGAAGTVVLERDHHDVMRVLERDMRSLLVTRGCSEEEMEEVRELLEVSATWMAAARRAPTHLDRLRRCVPPTDDPGVPSEAQVDQNLRFHYEILEAAGNRLLHLFAEPVSLLIYSFYRSEEHAPAYYTQVLHDHRRILAALEDRDADAARTAMSEHLHNTRDGRRARSSLTGLSFG